MGVGIGDMIFSVRSGLQNGLFAGDALKAAEAASGSSLNSLMEMDTVQVSALRAQISELLRVGGEGSAKAIGLANELLHPIKDSDLVLPVKINGYTDFLTSRHHTERNGRLKGLENPVPPVFLSLPVAYHGRVSSIRASGTPVIRPHGQARRSDGTIKFAPTDAMDFELELGAYIGRGNALGTTIPIEEAEKHIFGFSLLNDWSAKDMQWWEQMLGPLLGKNFMSSVSCWVTASEALAPFRTGITGRTKADPEPFPYLRSTGDTENGALDIELEAWIRTPAAQKLNAKGVRLARTNPKVLSWSFAQMLTHHASNGCNLCPGDLIGSGTISGEEAESRACMTEITEAGRLPVSVGGGETRSWLQDGDEVIFKGRAVRDGFVPISLGECRGRVLPAVGVTA